MSEIESEVGHEQAQSNPPPPLSQINNNQNDEF